MSTPSSSRAALLPLLVALACLAPPARASGVSGAEAPLAGFAPALQYAAGLAGGLAGSLAGAGLGMALEGCEDGDDDASSWFTCGARGAFFGGALGYSAGTVLGVSGVGKAAYGRGHWGSALLGNVLGAGAAFLVGALLPDTRIYALGDLRLVSVLALTPAFTVAGYHAGRTLELRAVPVRDGAALRLQTSF